MLSKIIHFGHKAKFILKPYKMLIFLFLYKTKQDDRSFSALDG